MTAAVIANGSVSLYSAWPMVRKGDTSAAERADLERRVGAGEWLRIGDAAKVLGVSRTKTDALIRRGTIGYRLEPDSRYRQCNPGDIRRLLDEYRQERRTTSEDAPTSKP